MEVYKQIKNRTIIWPSNSTFGYLAEENEKTNPKTYVHPNVHCIIIYNSQDMKTT